MALQEDFETQGNWLFSHRSMLPLTVLLADIAVYWFTIRSAGTIFMTVFPHWQIYKYACLAVSLSGLAVRIYTVGHTPAGTSGRNTSQQVASKLNTSGTCYMTNPCVLYRALGNCSV